MLRSISTLTPLLLALPAFAQAENANGAEHAQPAAHWSQWRGAARNGQSGGPAWPRRLTAENFVQQWRIPLQSSYSGPVVDATRVYTTETVDKRDECVRALDRKTGEEIWKHSWSGAMKVPFFAARNGSWIRSTPTLDEGRLFVAGMRDVLVCLDAKDGSEVWSVDFTERYGTPIEDFGFVCSPLVHGDHVFVQTGAGLIKLDKRTGESKWRALAQKGGDMMKSGAFSSPVFAHLHDRDQLLVQGRSALHGIDVETGEELWSIRIRTFRGMNILTPSIYKGGIFTSAYGGRAHFFELTEDGDGVAVQEKWTNRAQGYMTSPVIIDGHAYLYLRSKRLACVNLDSGEVAWISDNIGDTYWSLVANGDRILALGDAGELRLIAANPERYEEIDYFEVTDHETWAHLAVDGGQVFVRELEGLAAYSWK